MAGMGSEKLNLSLEGRELPRFSKLLLKKFMKMEDFV